MSGKKETVVPYAQPNFVPNAGIPGVNDNKGVIKVSDHFASPGAKDRPAVNTPDEAKRSGSDGEVSPVHDHSSQPDYACPRFRTPAFLWMHEGRFYLAELVSTVIFCTLIYLAQGDFNIRFGKFETTPTTPDTVEYLAMSSVKAAAAFLATGIFWNYGKPQFNPAITLSYWMAGHMTILSAAFRMVVQGVGACVAFGLTYGFVNTKDVSAGPGLVATHSASYYFLFEFLATWILTSIILWAIGSDKLFKEMAARAMSARGAVASGEGASPTLVGDGSQLNNAPALGTLSVPAEYQQVGPHLSFETAIYTAVTYGVVNYVGYLVCGDPVLNFLLWFPRVFNISDKNTSLAIPMWSEGLIYFFTAMLGGLVAGFVFWLFAWWTRKTGEDMDKDRVANVENDAYIA